MANIHLRDVSFLRMWPRALFKKKEKDRSLSIKRHVPEIERPGVYVLYRSDELYYVGRANRLMSRLHDHANKVTDEYYAHWDYFSAFVINEGVSEVERKLAEIEAILIVAMPRSTNRAKPKFKRIQIPKQLRYDESE